MNVSPASRLPAELSQVDQIKGRSPEELHKAGQEFESYFISYLMKTMRETVPKGMLDRKGEEVWYSFYDQEIARLATQAGGIGITQVIDAYTERVR
ncbi:MAG: rod-binding protein [Nitrospiraceae bacterium]|nr:rod-binding protein [Nitrospiraceae bacterium]